MSNREYNHDVHELYLVTVNEQALYAVHAVPAISAHGRLMASGKYNAEEAMYDWVAMAKAGARLYVEKFGQHERKRFTPEVIRKAAEDIMEHYSSDVEETAADYR